MRRELCVVVGASLPAALAHAAPPAYHAQVNAGAPVLWYQFGEAAGGTTLVNSGTLGPSHNATLHNGVTLGVATSAGDTGAYFDQTMLQWAESAGTAPANLTGNPSFTCELVIDINEASTGTNYAPFLYWGANGTMRSVYYSIHLNNSSRGYTGFYNGGLRQHCPYPVDGWLHLVWTRDSAGGTNDCITGSRFWVNGVEVMMEPDTSLCCSGGSIPNVAATTFRIQRANDFTRYMTGLFDELALYDRVLSDQEIQDHYATLGFEDPVPCRADVNNDCVVTPADFSAWIAAFNAQSAACDQNGDGLCTPADFSAWIANFNAGC